MFPNASRKVIFSLGWSFLCLCWQWDLMKSEIHVRYELIILFMDSCPCQIIFLSPMRGHLWCLQGGWDARRILAKSRCRVASRAVMWMFQWFTWHGHLAASFFLYKKSKDKRFGNDNNNNNNLSVATCFWLHAPTADVYIHIYIYMYMYRLWMSEQNHVLMSYTRDQITLFDDDWGV